MLIGAGKALDDLVVRRPMREGARLPEAGDRAIDEPRVDARERGVVEAEPRHHARTEVLDERVGARDQAQEDLPAVRDA